MRSLKRISSFAFFTLLVLGNGLLLAAEPTAKTVDPAESLGWQLAVHSYTFQKFTLFEAIDKTHSLGLKYMSISGGFTYVASDFISANPTVPLANLSTCTVTATPSAACGDMSFAPGAYGYDQVAIGIPTSPSSGVSILYYFNRGAFAAPGSYHTDDAVFGNGQAGRLLVSAVPEPQSAAMLLAGLGLITAWRLRRKAGPVAALRPSTPGSD